MTFPSFGPRPVDLKNLFDAARYVIKTNHGTADAIDLSPKSPDGQNFGRSREFRTITRPGADTLLLTNRYETPTLVARRVIAADANGDGRVTAEELVTSFVDATRRPGSRLAPLAGELSTYYLNSYDYAAVGKPNEVHSSTRTLPLPRFESPAVQATFDAIVRELSSYQDRQNPYGDNRRDTEAVYRLMLTAISQTASLGDLAGLRRFAVALGGDLDMHRTVEVAIDERFHEVAERP